MGFSNKDSHKDITDYEADMFTGITTYHGFVRIYNSKHWFGRTFWILVVVTAFTVFMVQAYSLLRLYKAKPTNYQSDIFVPSDGVNFPDVTICNFNPVKKTIAEKKWMGQESMTEGVFEYIIMAYKPVENLYSYLNSTTLGTTTTQQEMENLDRQLNTFNQTFTKRHNHSFYIPDFFNESGYDCVELILECAFAGFVVEDCCNYTTSILTDLGKCFTLSGLGESDWKDRQFISGSSYGLQLTLDTKRNEYSHAGASDAGIKFYTHRKGDHPFLSARGVAIPPGHKGYAALTLTNWSLLTPEDWGQCRKSWHEGDPVYLSKYTMTNCQANCMANIFLKFCGCVPMRFYINDTLDVCSPLSLYNCLNMTRLRKNKRYWYQSCTKCTVECDRVDYHIEMSYSSIEMLTDNLFQDKKINKSYIEDNFVLLDIFMKDIAYTEHIQQQAVTATTLLSDIGGNTGMFLGMSVITLGEIFIFFVKCGWGLLDKRRRKEIAKRERETNPNDDASFKPPL